jgi:hypothetical protein
MIFAVIRKQTKKKEIASTRILAMSERVTVGIPAQAGR